MDFVTAWKATSIVLTGAFGVLGLLKDFKDKNTGQVTKWGRLSLAGILLSSGLGVIAQFKESSRQEQSRQTTANQTLALAQKTDQTVQDLQRILSPLDDLRINIGFYIPCDNPKYKAFCLAMNRKRFVPESAWDQWPGGDVSLLIQVFVDPKDAQGFLEHYDASTTRGDLMILVNATARNKSLSAFRWLENEKSVVEISISNYVPGPSDIQTKGKIKSTLDLHGATVFITWPTKQPGEATLDDLRLGFFNLSTKSGERIVTDASRFERLTVKGETMYRSVFP